MTPSSLSHTHNAAPVSLLLKLVLQVLQIDEVTTKCLPVDMHMSTIKLMNPECELSFLVLHSNPCEDASSITNKLNLLSEKIYMYSS
jgi:hypothetical protein